MESDIKIKSNAEEIRNVFNNCELYDIRYYSVIKPGLFKAIIRHTELPNHLKGTYTIKQLNKIFVKESENVKVDLTKLSEVNNTDEAITLLREYLKENKISITKPVYTITVEDVLSVIAHDNIEDIISGKYKVEELINAVKENIEIDWVAEIQAAIKILNH